VVELVREDGDGLGMVLTDWQQGSRPWGEWLAWWDIHWAAFGDVTWQAVWDGLLANGSGRDPD